MNMLAIAYLLDLFGDWKYALEKIVFAIPNLIFLTLDGIVYSVLGYAYKLFELMSRLNLSTFKTWFDPIIENISALIIVVVIFAVGYALINYLINPDKVSDQKIGGMALIKNIAIAAVFLIIYNEFFKTMDDVAFLLIGAPEGTSYSSEIFEAFGIENDGSPGLISNVVYGSNSSSSDEETVDFGVSLAVNTLNIFLHSKGTGTVVDQAYREAIEGKNFGLMKITAAFMNIESFLNDSSTGEVQYRFPILSTVVGLFIVYMLVTISIELGIRALKLIILELLAPIAIITIIKDGMEAKMWKNWWSVFWKTYADIFIRVASMYIVVGIISRAWKNIADLFVNSATSGDFTQYLLLVMIIIAGFKLAKELPGFIDSILGSKLADNNKNGFKNFLGGLAGGLVGGISGVATGVTSGISNKAGVLGTTWNALKGGVNGGVAGSKGKGIADTMKKISENNKANTTRAQAIGRQGGGLRYLGANIEKGFGVPQRNINQRQSLLDENTLIDNVINAQAQEIKGDSGSYGLKFGADRDAYAQSYAQKATSSAQAGVTAAQQQFYNPAYQAFSQKLSGITVQRNGQNTPTPLTVEDYNDSKEILANQNSGQYTAQQIADANNVMAAINAALPTGPNNAVNADIAAYESAKATYENAQNAYNTAYSTAVAAGEKEWMNAASAAQGTAVKAAKDELRIKNGNTVGMNQAQLRTLKKTNKAKADAIASKGSVRRYERQGHYSSK